MSDKSTVNYNYNTSDNIKGVSDVNTPTTAAAAATTTQDIIKDIIYQKLDQLTLNTIQEQFLANQGASTITEITQHCMPKILKIQSADDLNCKDQNAIQEQNTATFATVLLHYLLTNLLIPSQRKTIMRQINIDIIIPDTKTLQTNWNSCLILCILYSTQKKYIENKIFEVKKIQPNQQNIWLVSPKSIPNVSPHKMFVVDSNPTKNTFCTIIEQITKFVEKNRSSKFKIFKAV